MIPVKATLLSSVEPLNEQERIRFDQKLRREQRKALLRWVNDGLLVAALKDRELARAICRLAGFLARKEPIRAFDAEHAEFRQILQEEMKRGKIWDRATLKILFIDYAHYLLENNDEKQARLALARKWHEKLGYELVDGRWQVLLSQAATRIPLGDWPEHMRSIVEKRLDVGQKRKHRGVGAR